MPWQSIIKMLFIYVAMLLVLAVSSSASSCPQVNIISEYAEYVQKEMECNEYNTLLFFVYEDCPNDKMIFEVETGFTIDACNGEIVTSGNQFGFVATKDAESPSRLQVCSRFLTDNTEPNVNFNAQFNFMDVNEFPPQPSGSLEIVQSIYFDENDPNAQYEFSYVDFDYGETQTLDFTLHSDSDAATMFEIEIKEYNEQNDVMDFLLKVTKPLDFEIHSLYTLLVELTSEDPRGIASSFNQTFRIIVNDLGDSPPIFTRIQPFASCDEEARGELIFQVKAQDSDTSINNKILYSIVSGNDDEFFEINEELGEIYTSRTKNIDRETLVSTFFPLEIQAMEVLDEEGSPAPDPATTSQVTNVNILDINDNIPVFDNDNFEVEMNEFDETLAEVSKRLDLVLNITDMDEGVAGEYTLSSNNTNVELNPKSGAGRTQISITLLESEDFDYEAQADNPIVTIQIIATEKENDLHTTTAMLNINLLDINDKPPIFAANLYQAEVEENITGGSDILEVSATDDDVTPEFGEDGFVYSLHNCGEKLTIDQHTGKISLLQSTKLDYEKEKEIECTVRINDMEGQSSSSLSDEVSLIIMITDVNDEFPSIDICESTEISEAAETNSVVASVVVTDPDTEACLEVSLEFENSMKRSVTDWFYLSESSDSTQNKYKGDILVGDTLDRETAEKVVLQIKAVDKNATLEIQERLESLQVVLLDVNDETPEFVGDYSSQKVDENITIDTIIFTVLAIDQDNDDEITFSIVDSNRYLKIDPNTGDVLVQTVIDREITSEFEVEIFATDKVGHSNSVKVKMDVIDINDNEPILNEEICNTPYNVSEDAEEGYPVATIKATDADEGIHAKISYILENSNYIIDDIQFAPFAIEKATGEITVHKTESNKLDRERHSKWTLVVDAFDNCDTNDPKCQVNSGQCFMTVNVNDVNDNGPENFKLSTGSTIITDEALLKGDTIPELEVSAVDPDQPNDKNSQLTFEVLSMTFSNHTATDLFFEANNGQRINSENIVEFYCTLRATVDLTGLQGDYFIKVQATDNGEPQHRNSKMFPLSIQDINDMSPIFSFSPCLIDSQQTIYMKENLTPLNTALKCTSEPNANVAEIMLIDDDKPQTPNSKVMLEIDYESSVAVDGGPDNQLNAFLIHSYEDEGRFAVVIQEEIDRERGIKYNLSLVGRDAGDIPNETPSWIFIIVEDIPEFPPTFCDQSPCKETLYLKENSDAVAKFSPAQDKDNGNEEINQMVYYNILNSDMFEIPDPEVPEVKPVVPLDRETCDKYFIKIWAYNEPPDYPDTEDSNQILSATVEVLDVNDEIPSYDDVIYGEFSDTGSKIGEEVALLEFLDKDFNDSLTYAFVGEFVWSEGFTYPDPFKIERLDERKSKITLNIDPQGKSGYCSFQVEATDEASHIGSANVEVFVVTNEYVVSFYFLNDKEEVDKNQENIEDIFTLVFGYTCVIDRITSAKDKENNEIKEQTVVLAHFIREKETDSNNEDNEERRFLKMKSKPKQRGHTTLRNENQKKNNQLKTQDTREIFQKRKYHSTKSKEQLNSRKDQDFVNSHLDRPLMGYFYEHISQNKEGLRIPRKPSSIPAKEQSRTADQEEYELVPKEDIEKMGASGTITSELDSQLGILGLNLARIGAGDPLDQGSGNEQAIINLKIALASICLFLGLLIVLLVIVFIVKTTKLKREIKALSTQAMMEGKSNENCFEMAIPGSNRYANEVTNPIWNLKEDPEHAADAQSNSSGGSVLAGTEKNPIFQYQPKGEEDEKQTSKGDNSLDLFCGYSQNLSGTNSKVNLSLNFGFENGNQETDCDMPFEASLEKQISQHSTELTK